MLTNRATSRVSSSSGRQLTPDERIAIARNLFHGAHWILNERPDFPWHRDGKGRVTASETVSSQALALDVFATINRLPSRNVIMNRIAQELGVDAAGSWTLDPEMTVEKELLGEPRPTQIDVFAEAERSLILFECKFTEPDGGGCSQIDLLRTGAHRGLRQCNGNYEVQINPVSGREARCVLTAKGVRYWELIPRVLRVDSETDHVRCLFRGGWYQWMRNLTAAAALSSRTGKGACFVIVYADGSFPMALKIRSPKWADFTSLLTGHVQLQCVSYQQLVRWACEAAVGDDIQTLRATSGWIDSKIEAASRRRDITPMLDRAIQ